MEEKHTLISVNGTIEIALSANDKSLINFKYYFSFQNCETVSGDDMNGC